MTDTVRKEGKNGITYKRGRAGTDRIVSMNHAKKILLARRSKRHIHNAQHAQTKKNFALKSMEKKTNKQKSGKLTQLFLRDTLLLYYFF